MITFNKPGKLVPETLKSDDFVQDNLIEWESPSNIALVKYWGKKGDQLPSNPSVSLTLSRCKTITKMQWWPKVDDGELAFSFLFEGRKNEKFHDKISTFFNKIKNECPWLTQIKMEFESENTFPHSAGIASSASSMSALALCLTTFEQRFFSLFENEKSFQQRASHLARLGSGSACRSLFSEAAVWGEGATVGSCDFFAEKVNEIHAVFQTMMDSVLIVSKAEKGVSSTAGHAMMKDHPYAERRFELARQRCHAMIDYLKNGDIQAFGQMLEQEAFDLHGLMANGKDSYILMKPETLKVIELIREFRRRENIPVYFTLDAGPNVHMLYEKRYQSVVQDFIRKELSDFLQNKEWINDEVGKGPVRLN